MHPSNDIRVLRPLGLEYEYLGVLWRLQSKFCNSVFQLYGCVSCAMNNVKSAQILVEMDLVSRREAKQFIIGLQHA